jgi:hypothetical protein
VYKKNELRFHPGECVSTGANKTYMDEETKMCE